MENAEAFPRFFTFKDSLDFLRTFHNNILKAFHIKSILNLIYFCILYTFLFKLKKILIMKGNVAFCELSTTFE